MRADDELLDTREGLALAHGAWIEGCRAGISACNRAMEIGVMETPRSPYSAPLLRKIKEADDESV